MLKPCAICGENTNRRKFCSTKCYKLHRKEYMRKHHRDNRERVKKHRKKYEKKRHTKSRVKLLVLIGDKCIICNTKYNIEFHEKYFREYNRGSRNLYKLKNYKDFIPMCSRHHKILHIIRNITDLDYDKLKQLLKFTDSC